MGKERDLLDRALAGQPADVKARVLDIVLRLGLDPSDDLFLIMIAFGALQVLLEDYPETLNTLFDEFRGDITTWSDQHLGILETLSRKAQTEQLLANNSAALLSGLEKLTDICTRLMRLDSASASDYRRSTSPSTDSSRIDSWITILRQDITNHHSQATTLQSQQSRVLSMIADEVQRLRALVFLQFLVLGGGIAVLLILHFWR